MIQGPAPVVVVTGASAGVGRATALLFAKQGAKVGLLARDPQALKQTRLAIEREGGRALDTPADVANPDEVESAARTIEQELGSIDIWVNNAMASVFSPFAEMSEEDFKRVTEVTYLGAVNGTRSALKRMLPRNSGCIVQVGSALAYRGIPLQAAYCGAKHALQGFSESVRCELIHDKSRVHLTSVHLPALNTPQFNWVKTSFTKHPQPVPPIFEPELAADAIWWASQHRRREWHVGAPTALTIAGNKAIPGLLDRYLGRTGYESQLQPDHPIPPDRPDNLWQPVENEHSTHGNFGDQAKAGSLQWRVSKHRTWLALGTGALGGALALWKRD